MKPREFMTFGALFYGCYSIGTLFRFLSSINNN